MKKSLVLALSALFVLSLCSCGSTSSPAASAAANAPAETAGQMQSEQAQSTPAAQDIMFTELTVVNDENCTIKITGIDPDNIWGFTLDAYLENKSTDTTYMYSVASASINGVQADPLFATEVAAGKKSNEGISFADDTIKQNGITEFTDIELTFRVYDTNNWAADDVETVTVHVYPYGEDKATAFVREAQSTDTVVVDNEYATVIVTGYEDDPIWGYTANLFLVNKTDKNIMFSVNDASVNGFMADPFYAHTVTAGKSSFSSMSWSDTSLQENNISTVEEIEFLLRAYDADNWTGEDFINETVTLNP